MTATFEGVSPETSTQEVSADHAFALATARSWTDKYYLDRLLSDPAGALAEVGYFAAHDSDLRVLVGDENECDLLDGPHLSQAENGASYLVLPPRPTDSVAILGEAESVNAEQSGENHVLVQSGSEPGYSYTYTAVGTATLALSTVAIAGEVLAVVVLI